MGYVLMYAPCCICGKIFGCNPHRVPSVRIDGIRQGICEDCIHRINPLREAKGLEPAIVHADAYEPVDEMEM